MSRGTVVVEAALRSGALITARRAGALGRMVIGVPGPVTAPQSAGVHQLLREEDTFLVTGAAEIIENVGRIGEDLAPRPTGPAQIWDALTTEAVRVLEAVPPMAAASPADIAREAGVAPAAVALHLHDLHTRGLIRRPDPDTPASDPPTWQRT